MLKRLNASRRGAYRQVSVLVINAALFAIAATTASLPGKAASPRTPAANAQAANTSKWWHPRRLAVEGNMPPLDGATAWINSQPLNAADLRGIVVLVEFWTLHLHQLAPSVPICSRVG